ncbi:MAG: hypothetical protein ACI8PT_003497 [Gammaproteobacteria bacterium]|jgi:hypothetical protein
MEVLCPVPQVVQHIGQDVADALGDDARPDGDAADALGHIRTVSRDGGRAQRRPDKPLGDVGVSSIRRHGGYSLSKRESITHTNVATPPPAWPVGCETVLLHLLRTQRVERSMDIGNRIERARRECVGQRQHQLLRCCVPLATTKHCRLTQLVK